MEEQNPILTAIQQLEQKFDRRFDEVDRRFDKVDKRFEKLEEDVDKLHQSQIKLEGMESDIKLIAEDLTHLKNRFAAWDQGEEAEESIPVRVSRLEMRVTRLEKKKRT